MKVYAYFDRNVMVKKFVSVRFGTGLEANISAAKKDKLPEFHAKLSEKAKNLTMEAIQKFVTELPGSKEHVD